MICYWTWLSSSLIYLLNMVMFHSHYILGNHINLLGAHDQWWYSGGYFMGFDWLFAISGRYLGESSFWVGRVEYQVFNLIHCGFNVGHANMQKRWQGTRCVQSGGLSLLDEAWWTETIRALSSIDHCIGMTLYTSIYLVLVLWHNDILIYFLARDERIHESQQPLDIMAWTCFIPGDLNILLLWSSHCTFAEE